MSLMSTVVCAPFDPEVETVSEFLARFTVQCYDLITGTTANPVPDSKKAGILIKALPVPIVTAVIRGLKPKELSNATFKEVTDLLRVQYEVKKSLVAASYSFVSRKQKPGESIESYAQCLNDLADACNYEECCRSRYMRDIFVGGLISPRVISALLHQDCDQMTFKDAVQRAKTTEAFSNDVQNLKHENRGSAQCNKVHYENKHKPRINDNSGEVPSSYVCIRCGAKASHFAKACYAIQMTCRSCGKIGHLAKCCKRTQKSAKNMKTAHAIEEEPATKPSTNQLPRTNECPCSICSAPACNDDTRSSYDVCNAIDDSSNNFDNFLW